MGVQHVLVVEDDEAERFLLRTWLLRQSDTMVVEQAVSLQGAIAQLRAHPSNVVLLDLGLPDSFGLPTVKALLPEARDAAIVVLSSQADTNVALQALKEGTPITLTASIAQGGLRLCVPDCGSGLAEDDYQAVFEPFVRGKHSNTAIAGTGLGLSIVKDYVELHAGHVHAEPNQPHGCAFVVWLPRTDPNNIAELRVWEGIFYARRSMLSVAVLNVPQGNLPTAAFRRAVQEILPQLLRQGDRITYSPQTEQAMVVLIDTDRLAATRVASKIRDGMLPHLPEWEAQHIGLAVFPEDGATPQELIAAARAH